MKIQTGFAGVTALSAKTVQAKILGRACTKTFIIREKVIAKAALNTIRLIGASQTVLGAC